MSYVMYDNYDLQLVNICSVRDNINHLWRECREMWNVPPQVP